MPALSLGLVCFALVASKCLNEYWHEFKPKALSLCSAGSYYFKHNMTTNSGMKHMYDHVHCRETPHVTASWHHCTTNREKVCFFGFRLWHWHKQISQENTQHCPLSAVITHSLRSFSAVWIYARYSTSTTVLSNCVMTGNAKDIRWCGQDSGMPWRWATPCSQECCL